MGAPLWLASRQRGHVDLRFFIAAVPASLVAIFAGIVALLALFLDKGRRDYALHYADRCVDFAAALVGTPRLTPGEETPPADTDMQIGPAPPHHVLYRVHELIDTRQET
jgi:hypothetical protein